MGGTASPVLELRPGPWGQGLYASRALRRGERLFGPDEFASEEERAAFVDLSPEAFAALPPAEHAIFLRFAYSAAPALIRGTFHHEAARHPSNFINHACDPNAGYDGTAEDDIVALRDIAAGEQLCMDYGTCTFGFDHEFACRCGARHCRGQVRGDDWQALTRAGVPLLSFMRPRIARFLAAEARQAVRRTGLRARGR